MDRYIHGVGILYLAALILGAGTIAVQLLMGHDASAGADMDADADFDADADMDVAGGAQLDAVHEADTDAGGFAAIFLSLRFWTFGFLAFGMVGTLLHYLRLSSSSSVTLIAALAMGLGSGFLASWVFRALKRSGVSSAADESDAVGQVGKVLVPCERGGHAKVRLELRGQSIDFLATTDDESLDDGELVMVEELRDGTLHVSKAPPDFLSGRDKP